MGTLRRRDSRGARVGPRTPYDEDRVRLCGSDRLLADEMIGRAIGDAWLPRFGPVKWTGKLPRSRPTSPPPLSLTAVESTPVVESA